MGKRTVPEGTPVPTDLTDPRIPAGDREALRKLLDEIGRRDQRCCCLIDYQACTSDGRDRGETSVDGPWPGKRPWHDLFREAPQLLRHVLACLDWIDARDALLRSLLAGLRKWGPHCCSWWIGPEMDARAKEIEGAVGE